MVAFHLQGWCWCYLHTAYCRFPAGRLQCRRSERTLAFLGINGTHQRTQFLGYQVMTRQVVIQLFFRATTLNVIPVDVSCYIECCDLEDDASPRGLLGRQMSGTLKHLIFLGSDQRVVLGTTSLKYGFQLRQPAGNWILSTKCQQDSWVVIECATFFTGFIDCSTNDKWLPDNLTSTKPNSGQT